MKKINWNTKPLKNYSTNLSNIVSGVTVAGIIPLTIAFAGLYALDKEIDYQNFKNQQYSQERNHSMITQDDSTKVEYTLK